MPDWKNDIQERLRGLRLSPADQADVAEELAQHLDDRYHELRSRGASDEDARRSAVDELGEFEVLRDRLHSAMRSAPLPPPLGASEGRGVTGIWGDLRFGARMLRRSPGFTITAALTIALGLGATTTIFSVVNALLLRPLPGTVRSGELVMIGRTQDGRGFDTFSYPDFLDYRAGARSLSSIAATFVSSAQLGAGSESEAIRAELVSGDYFRVLGTRPVVGRLLAPDDDGGPGASPVVVLAHATWQDRFGSDPSVIGRSVRIDGSPFTVVGVTEPGFNGSRMLGVVDVFIPMSSSRLVLPELEQMRASRGAVWLDIIGRLAPNVTLGQAEAELKTIGAELSRRFPDTNRARGVRLAGGFGLDPDLRTSVTRFMSVLLAVVGFVLLIACANVANLLLARGSARARELAVRASLGASRGRLVRQLLAEGFLLAILGGLAGLAAGVWATRLVIQLPAFANSFGAVVPQVDHRVLAFSATAILLSGLLFALPPAFRTSRVDLSTALKQGTPGSGDGRSRLRSGLVVAQLALSLMLLVGAGLFVRTLQALYAIDPGFETKRVVMTSVDARLQGYDEARGRQLFDELEARVSALPGVEGAALAYMVPLGGGGWDTRVFPAEAKPARDDPGLKTDVNTVSPTYFATLGMTLVSGRGFSPADRSGAPAVAVINDAMANRLWPGRAPIGQRFRVGWSGELIEVVGVARTARYRTLEEAPRPFYYRPFAQVYRSSMTLHVRTSSANAYAIVPAIRRVVDELDRDIPLTRVTTLAERLDGSLGPQRTAAMLVAAYGVLALVLAAVGLYGAMSYAVSRRTREMGVRMALGARASAVRAHVLWQAVRIALIGATIGLVAAIPLMRLIRAQLYGVGPNDPTTLLVVVLVLAGVSIVAAYLPARRATKVDPVIALRSE